VTLRARWVTLSARWVTLRARWVAICQVRETRRMCEMEVQTVKHRATLALTAKNHEIQQFQIELEGILRVAATVPRSNHGGGTRLGR
jgi:hypothetical protein